MQAFVVSARAYCIKIDIAEFTDQNIYLHRYHGSKYVPEDSTTTKKGIATFKGKKDFPKGIYFVGTKEEKLFDFLISDSQKLSLKTNYNSPIESLEVIGNDESKQFNNFIKSKKSYNENKLNELLKNIPENNFLHNFINIIIATNTNNYEYILKLDFSDESLLNTPEYAFEKLLSGYCEKNIDQYSENLELAYQNADKLAEATNSESQYRKFILEFMIERYQNPKNLKLEAIFIHLFNQYYKSAKPWWISDYDYSILKWKISVTKDNIIGLVGKDIKLPDSKGEMLSLYEMKSKYKIIVFWDSECESCIEAVTNLYNEYHNLKTIGAEVFAVYTEAEYEQWAEYVSENELTWINVSDPESIGTYANDYGTIKSPRFYLLDEHNIIISKDFEASKTYETIIEHEQKIKTK